MTEDFETRALEPGDLYASNAVLPSSTWLNKTPTEILSDVNAALTAVWGGLGQRPDVIPKWWEDAADGLPKWRWPEPRHIFFNPLLGMMYGLRPEVVAAPDRIVMSYPTYYWMFGHPTVRLMLRRRRIRRPKRFTWRGR